MRKSPILLACLATIAWPPWAAALQVDDDQPINIELKAADLEETLRSFAEISGRQLVLDPGVAGAVTIDLEKVGWKKALGRICADHELSCELLGGEPPVLRVRAASNPGGPPLQAGVANLLDLSLRKADLRETLAAFGAITGGEVVVDDRVEGTVTLDVQSVPWPILLEEVCALSGCRVERQDGAIHVLPAEAGSGDDRRGDLRLQGATLEEALEIVAGLPIFGHFGVPVVDLGEEVETRVDADLENATWPEMLRSLCEDAGCRFVLRYGAPSRLEVRLEDPRLEGKVSFGTRETSLGKAAAALAGHLELAPRLDDGLDPAAAVRFEAETLTWKEAMRQVCRQAACSWTLEDRHLHLHWRLQRLATRPVAGTRGVDLGVRFATPEGPEIAAAARFTWAEPIFTAGAEGASYEARLSWIPFGPDRHFVLPFLARCEAGDVRELEVLPLVRLPLAGVWEGRYQGAVLELETPAAEAPESREEGWISACLEGRRGPIEATFYRRDGPGKAPRDRAVAELPKRIGGYLLVTPPRGLRPVAAVVVLGRDPQGGQRLALVRPGDDLRGDLEVVTLAGTEALRRTFAASDGSPFALEVRALER